MSDGQAISRLEHKVDMFRDEFRECFKLLNMRLDSLEDLLVSKAAKRDHADGGDRIVRPRKDEKDIDARIQQRYEHRESREQEGGSRDRGQRENNLRETLTRDLTPSRDVGASYSRPEPSKERRVEETDHAISTDKLHHIPEGSLDSNTRTCSLLSSRL